ncbi:MFS transporter [Legionella cardiaca]|uniref:MFS transporter n=1 Tax=Legionella cardiaca TaxID=1071983 RepID=A0ABY8AQR8_9GAMM|nr:MFS transporter [Legionella cardiaca]WED42868.1 MFS transporter [Legionella cardiaca]
MKPALAPSQTQPPFNTVLPLYLVIFFGFVGYSLMITLFTPMILHGHTSMVSVASTMTWRTILLGILLALYPLGQFLGSPILGALSDHYGRRKILILSLLFTTIFYILITVSLYFESLTLLILGLFLAGLSEGNIVVAQGAIADIADESDRGRLFGYIYLSASSAYIIGPLLGGSLANPNIISWFNDVTPFAIVCVCLFAVLIWIFFNFRETLSSNILQEKIAYKKLITNFSIIFTAKNLRFLFFINFLLYLAIFGFFRCYPMYLVDEFHMQVGQLSQFIAWVAVPIIVGNVWLTGFLANRYSPYIMTVVSAVLTGIFMLIIIIPHHVNALWITLFLTSLALAICLPACATLLSVSTSTTDQGKVMGNNQSLQVLAEALSGIIGGLLAAIMVKLSLIVLALIAILAAALLFIAQRPGSLKKLS